MCGQTAFWSDLDCEKGHPSALNPPAGSSPHQGTNGGVLRRGGLPGMLSQLFCVLACLDKVIGSFRRSPRGGPSFLVITKVPGLLTILWPRDRWCDTAKGSGACESRGQTRHSRYTAYPRRDPDCMCHC